MILQSILCISAGAILGALGRWGLGIWLNAIFSTIAFGTLFANLIGCFLIGLFMASLWQYPQINMLWKLFVMTGFLGSFTTFSSFSAEVIELLMSDKWSDGLRVILLHLGGGLLCTSLGIILFRWLSNPSS